jgi:hypothetical protein
VLRSTVSHPLATGDSWLCCRVGAFRRRPRSAKKTQILVWFQRYFHKIPFIQIKTFPHDHPAPSRLCARGAIGRDVKGSSEYQCDAKRENSSNWHLGLLESEDHASPAKLLTPRADQQLQSVCVFTRCRPAPRAGRLPPIKLPPGSSVVKLERRACHPAPRDVRRVPAIESPARPGRYSATYSVKCCSLKTLVPGVPGYFRPRPGRLLLSVLPE